MSVLSVLSILSFLSDLVLTKLYVFLFPFSSRRCYCHGAYLKLTKWNHQLALSWHHHQSVKSQKHKSEKMTHVLGCWIICYKMSLSFQVWNCEFFYDFYISECTSFSIKLCVFWFKYNFYNTAPHRCLLSLASLEVKWVLFR